MRRLITLALAAGAIAGCTPSTGDPVEDRRRENAAAAEAQARDDLIELCAAARDAGAADACK